MTTQSRIVLAVASLMLIGVYFLPLWNISLEAPQYPEGIGLRIWVNNIDGQNPHDLDKINNLNHYIGMKKIVPDSILELKYMPYIIGFMIFLGLLTAYTGKQWLLISWLVIFIIICFGGLYDFYLWGYDYGHNLDTENAIIKIPGMSYQPPVIGSKKLLNFNAISLPAIGGYLVMLSIMMAAWAAWPWFRRKKTLNLNNTVVNSVAVVSLLFSIFSCSPEPRDIRYNEDICANCLMGIADSRFGTEIVTKRQKIYTFDSIECLVSYQLDSEETVHSLWVTDWQKPGQLIPASSSVYLQGNQIRSPMGLNILATADQAQVQQIQQQLGGKVLTWEQAKQYVVSQRG